MSNKTGRLILMPNTLDFGVDDSLDLREVLPQRVIERVRYPPAPTIH